MSKTLSKRPNSFPKKAVNTFSNAPRNSPTSEIPLLRKSTDTDAGALPLINKTLNTKKGPIATASELGYENSVGKLSKGKKVRKHPKIQAPQTSTSTCDLTIGGNGHSSDASGANSNTAAKVSISPPFPPMINFAAQQASVDFYQCLWEKCHVRCFQNVDMLLRHLINEHVVDCQPGTPQAVESLIQTNSLSSYNSNSIYKVYYCRWFDCERNDTPFRTRQQLLHHIRNHATMKSFKCSVSMILEL